MILAEQNNDDHLPNPMLIMIESIVLEEDLRPPPVTDTHADGLV